VIVIQRRTIVLIGCLVLLAAVPIGALALMSTDAGSAACCQDSDSALCDGCSGAGTCDEANCSCQDASCCTPAQACKSRAGGCGAASCCDR